MVDQIIAYKTTDGKVWEDRVKAIEWQTWLKFLTWCRENTCVGGEWTSDMVAKAIFETWEVMERPKSHNDFYKKLMGLI